MDLNRDGKLDILSGSYSREDQDMAGLFQVLWGKSGGKFGEAEVLNGSDGEPLILPAGEGGGADVNRICTRAFAADLNGDGKLDLVAGNFVGTFGLFAGEGNGKFAPAATWLEAGGKPMAVRGHSDPCLVDWDKDGDLDLLSGSADGGVFLFANIGTKKKPEFAPSVTLLEPAGHGDEDAAVEFGDAHCKAPATATRVWADDVSGDGKLDLIVGDQATLLHLADDVDESSARDKMRAWRAALRELFATDPGQDEAAQQRTHDAYEKLLAERNQFAREESTGFVWLLVQK